MKKVHIYTFGCAFTGNKTPESPTPRPWDLCLNAQHLKDPHASGLDPDVQKTFLMENFDEVEFIVAFADFVVNLAFRRFSEAAISINCKCGWARSVSLAGILADHFRKFSYEVEVVHLHHDQMPPGPSDCDD